MKIKQKILGFNNIYIYLNKERKEIKAKNNQVYKIRKTGGFGRLYKKREVKCI